MPYVTINDVGSIVLTGSSPFEFATPVMTDARKNKWIDPNLTSRIFVDLRAENIFNVKAEAG